MLSQACLTFPSHSPIDLGIQNPGRASRTAHFVMKGKLELIIGETDPREVCDCMKA